MSLEEKCGLMFQTVIEVGEDGELLEAPGRISKSPTTTVVLGKHLSHFNVHAIRSARQAAVWNNNLQMLAAQTPHGVPVTISTDPRHAFVENTGVGFAAGRSRSGRRDSDSRRSTTSRRCAGSPTSRGRSTAPSASAPPCTRRSTSRPSRVGAPGADARAGCRAGRRVPPPISGFQGDELGPDSVACTTKHFPGGGPQKDGEDAHFPYGREQVYPGGMFEYHLEPFREAIRAAPRR
jgi:beta-glucosidase